MSLFCYFAFERNYDVKESMLLFNKNKNFDKNELESKIKNPRHIIIPNAVLETRPLYFGSYRNGELKVKL